MRVLVAAMLMMIPCSAVAADRELRFDLGKTDWVADTGDLTFLVLDPVRPLERDGTFTTYTQVAGKDHSTLHEGAYQVARFPASTDNSICLVCYQEALSQIANNLKDEHGKSKALKLPLKGKIVLDITKKEDRVVDGQRRIRLTVRYKSDTTRIAAWKPDNEDLKFYQIDKNR